MRRYSILRLCGAALLGLWGCQTARIDSRPLADDPVCLKNGDMACVRVHVDGATPHAIYHGKTYYFCSEDCRKVFEKDPARYMKAEPIAGSPRT